MAFQGLASLIPQYTFSKRLPSCVNWAPRAELWRTVRDFRPAAMVHPKAEDPKSRSPTPALLASVKAAEGCG